MFPIVGWMLDKLTFRRNLAILVVMLVTYPLVHLITSPPVQIFNFVLYTITRALLYSLLTTFAFRAYGKDNFGRAWGLTQAIAGVVGTAQMGLAALGLVTSWLVVNVIHVAVQLVVGVLWFLALLRHERFQPGFVDNNPEIHEG
jgi:hypothetical protein